MIQLHTLYSNFTRSREWGSRELSALADVTRKFKEGMRKMFDVHCKALVWICWSLIYQNIWWKTLKNLETWSCWLDRGLKYLMYTSNEHSWAHLGRKHIRWWEQLTQLRGRREIGWNFWNKWMGMVAIHCPTNCDELRDMVLIWIVIVSEQCFWKSGKQLTALSLHVLRF